MSKGYIICFTNYCFRDVVLIKGSTKAPEEELDNLNKENRAPEDFKLLCSISVANI